MSNNVVRLPQGGGKLVNLNAGASHARFYSDWKHLDAYKTLTSHQRVILQDILMDYSKLTGNEVRLTGHGLTKKYRIGHRTAKAALLSLEEKGWIERIGLSPGPTGQAGGLYRILCISPAGSRVAGPYQRWQAEGSFNRNR